jgi:hypothetical protein
MDDLSNYGKLREDALRFYKEKPSQILRFKLLPLAVKLIKTATTYQEFEETLKEVEVKSFKKKIKQKHPPTGALLLCLPSAYVLAE